MSGKTVLLFAAAALLAAPAAAQTRPPPSAVPAAPASPAFPAGAEVLSVDGEPLGVLERVEARPGGERILHIRRPDGSTTLAPSVVASRGERAVVLDWTRAEFESGQAWPAEVAADVAEAPVPPQA